MRQAAVRTLVITPTYNEAENLAAFLKGVRLSLPAADILVADDSSPDGTAALAVRAAAEDGHVRVLIRARKEGLGRAYAEAFAWALRRDYTHIIQMDADLSHDPADLPRLMRAAETADLVIGSRYSHGLRVLNWPLRRLVLSRMAGLYVRLLTGLPVADPTAGYKLFRRVVLEAVGPKTLSSDGYAFQIETSHAAWRAGFKITEVPIVFADRVAGTSKLSLAIAGEAIGLGMRLFFRRLFRRKRA